LIREVFTQEKRIHISKLKEYYIIDRVFVENVQKQHSTEVTFTDVQVDTGIDSNLFRKRI
jgi:outer membrane lipoprotein-sorting protein